jgi:hypothetical protein
MRAFVMLDDGTQIYNDDPKFVFINIEENIYGEDVVTFEYEGKEYKSRVYKG